MWNQRCFLLELVIGLILCLLDDGSTSGLSAVVNLPCGDIHHCGAHEFCSDVDHKCRPCNKVCNEDDNSYNLQLCESQCQSYIHHSLYIPRLEAENFASKSDVQYVTRMLYAFVALCVVQTLVLIALMAFFGHRKLRRVLKWNRKKEEAMNSVVLDEKPEKLQTVAAQVENNENNNKRRIHKIGREPSESELPEYAAYDNHAMSISPSPVHSV